VKTIRSFRDLTVWQRSIELSVQIYALTRLFPKEEIFGLTNQLRRASASISSNIAEGQSRLTKGDFINFLSIARGSNAEVRSQLVLAQSLKFGDEARIAHCEALASEISKMLCALISSLKSQTPKPRPI
jgi:four helix bundle protein